MFGTQRRRGHSIFFYNGSTVNPTIYIDTYTHMHTNAWCVCRCVRAHWFTFAWNYVQKWIQKKSSAIFWFSLCKSRIRKGFYTIRIPSRPKERIIRMVRLLVHIAFVLTFLLLILLLFSFCFCLIFDFFLLTLAIYSNRKRQNEKEEAEVSQ